MEAPNSPPPYPPARSPASRRSSGCNRQRLEVLETEITTLLGHLSAGEYRFLTLLREYDRRQGWAQWGSTSCANWLNYRCGIGPVAARERVRVARALATLPLIDEAFRCGEVTYSKVRAMTRCATAANELYLLMIARYGTAAQLEKLCRNYRKVLDREELGRVNAIHAERSLYYFYDDDGALTIKARLTPDDGARVVAALDAVMEALWREQRDGPAAEGDDAEGAAAEGAEQDHDHNPGASAADTDPGGNGNETHSNDSAETFFAEPGPARNNVSARRADALVRMAETIVTGQPVAGVSGDRCQVILHVDEATLSGEDVTGECEIDHGPRVSTETARRLACDADVLCVVERDGEPLSIGRRSRSIPTAIRRALYSRDRGCRFPGCQRTRHLDGHHIRHWSQGGETSLENLALLCRFHHRLFHEGGFGIKRASDGSLQFTRPDGTPLPDTRPRPPPKSSTPPPPRDRRDAPDWNDLIRDNQRHGLDVGPDTCVSHWDGSGMDYCSGVEGLQQEDRAGEPSSWLVNAMRR